MEPTEVHERLTIADDLREIVREYRQSRDLLWQLALRDIKLRYKQAVMGFGWALFMPLLAVLAGLVVRLAMSTVSGRMLDRVALAEMLIKALGWSFFAGTIQFATPSLVGNLDLVTKVYFPREVLPLSAVLAQAADTAVGTVVVALLLLALGVVPGAALLWAPLLVVLLVMFTVAAALFLSSANIFFRDVKYIVQVLLTFGIFFTPVFFEPAALGARGRPWMLANPLTPFLEGLRLAVVRGHNLAQPLVGPGGVLEWDPLWLAYGAAWSVLGLVVASVLFHRAEFRFAEAV